jgi:hypothetical protein
MTLPSQLGRWCTLASIAVALLSTVAFASPYSIVPGKQAGSLRIQSYPQGLPLTNPDYSDGAMGQYTDMWVSKERDKAGWPTNTVVVRFTSNGFLANAGPGETVTYVRITSPGFRDAHGLSTGSTLASIQRVYRHLKPEDGKPGVLADDALGIGFDFGVAHPSASSRCIAISIFEKGYPVLYDADDVHSLVDGWKHGDRGSLIP